MPRPLVSVSVAAVALVLSACSLRSVNQYFEEGPTLGGNGGASGSTFAGAGGTATHGGTAGTAGAKATAGAAGSSGHGAGAGGSAGKGGGSQTIAGAGGDVTNAGGAGSKPACTVDADCPAAPNAVPSGCDERFCTEKQQCAVRTVDADGDGHRAATCAPTDPSVVIITGDDCNDQDPTIHPGAWDGPVGPGHATGACDGVDQDCDGLADNGKSSDGTACACDAGATQTCSQTDGGDPITYPTGTPISPCVIGHQTCSADGVWGPCVGATAPQPELCNHLDDDCNGVVDDGPPPDGAPLDAVDFVYDGDGDEHARVVGGDYARVRACAYDPPSTPPIACTEGPFDLCLAVANGSPPSACCPANAWRQSTQIPSDDCNDQDDTVHPGAVEQCDGVDHDCSGNTQPAMCVCRPLHDDNRCTTTDTGEPITWPQGVPLGTCHYGTRQCLASGLGYSPCLGAVVPAAHDQCGVALNDDDCDGTPNDGCACTGTATRSCGECSGGSQTCAGGLWSVCQGAPIDVSNPCDVDGKHVGACFGAGTYQCDAKNPGKSSCLPEISIIDHLPMDTYFSPEPSPNDSWDWDCDGFVEVQNGIPGTSVSEVWIPDADGDCDGTMTTYRDAQCEAQCTDATCCDMITVVHGCDARSADPSDPASFCGTTLSAWQCAWDTATLGCASDPSSYTQYTAGCR